MLHLQAFRFNCTVLEDVKIGPRTVAAFAFTVRAASHEATKPSKNSSKSYNLSCKVNTKTSDQKGGKKQNAVLFALERVEGQR